MPTPLITLKGSLIPSTSLAYLILDRLISGFKTVIPACLASSIYSLVLVSPPILVLSKLI